MKRAEDALPPAPRSKSQPKVPASPSSHLKSTPNPIFVRQPLRKTGLAISSELQKESKEAKLNRDNIGQQATSSAQPVLSESKRHEDKQRIATDIADHGKPPLNKTGEATPLTPPMEAIEPRHQHPRAVGFQLPTTDQSHNQLEEVDLEEDEVYKKLPNEHDVKRILKDRLPAGYVLGIAEKNNDNFFSAIAGPLSIILGAEISVQGLHLLCDEFVKNKKDQPAWVMNELNSKFGPNKIKEKFNYLARLPFTVAEMKTKHQTHTLIGDAIHAGEFEARMICSKHNISIHWIEVTDNGQVIDKLTTAENGTIILERGFDLEKYSDKYRIIHLVKSQSHIVPLINHHVPQQRNSLKNDAPVLSPPSSSNSVFSPRSNASPETEPLLSPSVSNKRNSVQMSSSNTMRRFRELVQTEYGFFERLKKFAMPQIAGKKVVREKTLWERILIKVGYLEEIDESNINKIDGGWARIRKIAEHHRLLTADELLQFDRFIVIFTQLAKGNHAFPFVDDPKLLGPEFEHLATQGQTDENFAQWVQVIRHCICVYPEFLHSIVPKMFEITAHKDNEDFKRILKKLQEGLSEVTLSNEDHVFFGGDTAGGYLESCISEPFQRVLRYPLLLKDMLDDVMRPVRTEIKNNIRSAIVSQNPTFNDEKINAEMVKYESHNAEEINSLVDEKLKQNDTYKALKEIHTKISEVTFRNQEAIRGLDHGVSNAQNLNSLFKPLERKYSEIGLSPRVVAFMSKLSTLIHYWFNDDLGEKIYKEQLDKIDNTLLHLEYEIKNGLGDETNNQQLIVKEKQKKIDLRELRANIKLQFKEEEKYVLELQKLLHLLFIDGNNPNYGCPLKSKLYDKIDEIIRNINNPNSVFCKSLKDLLEQDRSISYVKARADEKSAEKALSAPAPKRIRSTYDTSCLPEDIYTNNFIHCKNPPLPARSPFKHHSNYNQIRSAMAATQSSISATDHYKKLLDSHFIRLSIINQVKSYFAQLDAQLQHSFLYKLAGDSTQRISYRIQQELDTLLRFTPEELARICVVKSSSGNNKEIVCDVIINHIAKHLVVAGDIKKTLLSGVFGNTLDQVKDYLNSIVNSDNRKNSLHEMFVPMPSYIRKRAAQIFTASHSRPWNEKRFALIMNMMGMVDYYLGTGLGILLAKRADLPINKKLRHVEQIKLLGAFAKRMALDPRGEDQSEQVVSEILGGLKAIIASYPNEHSRSINELIHLHNNFTPSSDHEVEKDTRRFDEKDIKKNLIFDYKISVADAKDYIKLHLVQQIAQPFVNYSVATDERSLIETALGKDESNEKILSIFNNYYNKSLHDIAIECNKLPAGQQNIAYLLQKEINQVVSTELSDGEIFNQGLTGKTLAESDNLFEKIAPPLRKIDEHAAARGDVLQLIEPPADVDSDKISLLGHDRKEKAVEIVSPLTTVKMQRSDSFNFPEEEAAGQNQLLKISDKDALNILVSKVFALSHYYRNTEIGQKLCSKLSIEPNLKQGQASNARKIAEIALEIFLEDESDTEENEYKRNKKAQVRKSRLIDEIEKLRNHIRGDGSIWSNIVQSPDSRLAKALDELLPDIKQKMKKDKLPNKLQFTIQQNNALFDKKANLAKSFIHRVVVGQSCAQFVDLEKDLNGRLRKTAGTAEQKAAHAVHIELKKISTLDLVATEAEINALGPGKNIRDLIIKKVSDSVAHCGRIAECYITGSLGQKLFNVIRSLFIKKPDEYDVNLLRKTLTPNLVRRYKLDELSDDVKCPSAEKSRLGLSAILLMLYDYYLDNDLGRQVADRGAMDEEKKGAVAIYNNSSKGWRAQAEKIKEIATGLLYFQKFSHNPATARQEKINVLIKALTEINKIIKEIRQSGSCGHHSHFVNELIRIVTNFGKENGLDIKPCEKVNGEYLFPNFQHMFKHDIDQENAEDYIHQHLIFHTSSPLSDMKNKINGQRWTVNSEKAPLYSAETNLNKLFNEGVNERRAAIADLTKESRENAMKFVLNTDKDFENNQVSTEQLSEFVQRKKQDLDHKEKAVSQSSKYTFNIFNIIFGRLEKTMPYSSLFSADSNITEGQLNEPFEQIRGYVSDTLKPYIPVDDEKIHNSRFCF